MSVRATFEGEPSIRAVAFAVDLAAAARAAAFWAAAFAADAMASLARLTFKAAAASADFLSATDFAAAAAALTAAYLQITHYRKNTQNDSCLKLLLGSRIVASKRRSTGILGNLKGHTQST